MTQRCLINSREPYLYEIRLEGQLSRYHARHFEGMEISWNERGETVMIGPIADQAALHGLLNSIRDLAIPLLLLRRLSTESDVQAIEERK